MTKKRILFVGEASFLNTGFATYYRELLPRLVATGKYEIAELGCYARQDHPEINSFINNRWKFYGVMPSTEDEARIFQQACPVPRARGQNTNQFGEYKFDQVCADFKPDIVVDIRDWWMLEFQERSIFRDWFKWIVMPTVDAEPQSEEWIKTYENANIVLSYSDYGINVLSRQTSKIFGKPKMKIFPKPMRPGVDIKTFNIINKAEAKEHFNISKDIPVIGTVMRNQSRKLYPDLIDAFARMKKRYQGDPTIDKAVLLLHSSWPDNAYSYDYPRHVYRLDSYDWIDNHKRGIRGDILQTMFCWSCKQSSVTFAINLHGRPIDGGRIKLPCPFCGKEEASPPNTSVGFDRKELAMVYNAVDLYVQCSICEGDGMPIQEAKACGTPTLAVDYTAMREKGVKPDYEHLKNETNYSCHHGGDIIKVQRYYYEPETSCKRALPDIDDLALKMKNILTDKQKIQKMSVDARECVEKNYNWDELYKQWEFVFDNVKINDRNTTWESPVQQIEAVARPEMPNNLSDDQFIDWLYIEVLKYPMVDTSAKPMWISHLKQGVTRDALLTQFVSIANQQIDVSKTRDRIRQLVSGVEINQQNQKHKLEMI
jgi:glycosyltransferase involved in cell wall biosynthesis